MATITGTHQTTQPLVSPITGRRRRTRMTAVGVAVLITSGCYVIARACGTDFQLTDPGKTAAHKLILPEIVAFTAVFSLLGWGVLALLERYTRNAGTIWRILAGAVLLLSFMPIGLEQATTETKVMLAVIHTAVAAVLVPMLTGRTRRAR